jgi:hypothetical protein
MAVRFFCYWSWKALLCGCFWYQQTATKYCSVSICSWVFGGLNLTQIDFIVHRQGVGCNFEGVICCQMIIRMLLTDLRTKTYTFNILLLRSLYILSVLRITAVFISHHLGPVIPTSAILKKGSPQQVTHLPPMWVILE